MQSVCACSYAEGVTNDHSNKVGHTLISFSEFPRHLDPTEDADMLKKVVLHSVATALANSVLPVPGGPYNRMPCSSDSAGSLLP